METVNLKLGDCSCLDSYVQHMLYQAVSAMEHENFKKEFAISHGAGESPFQLCMQAHAGGPGIRGGRQVQREKFGEAARFCAGYSKDPKDRLPELREERQEIDELLKAIAYMPICQE